MLNILIIGYGVVGKNLESDIKSLAPDIIDKYKPEDNRISESSLEEGYDLAFICVNTPFIDDETPCDYSEVINAINENKDKMKKDGIFVIKSTILPGTLELIKKETKQNVIFSPEYFGSTQHNNFESNFTILGGKKEDCIKVIQILQEVYDGRHRFFITDSKTAELVKYMENAWLATKVSFCSQFFDIAEKEGVNYEELRELFILDPRVNPSHTFIYRDHPYWESHCLDKDVPAIAISEDAEFLKAVIEYNEKRKKALK